MTPSTLVEVVQVTKTFQLGQNLVKALDDISIQFEKGGFTALMGPSGSGKSTLLNMIGALDQPTSGKIIFSATELGKLNAEQKAEFRNETVGFIFQNFNLIPVLTTLENITLPSELSSKSTDRKVMDRRAKELLELVGLAEQTHQSVNKLSGGQMQRVAIARALMNSPPLILGDELTANLDHQNAMAIMDLLRQLSQTQNTTIVIATHDSSVLPYCRRIVKLRDGRIVSDEQGS